MVEIDRLFRNRREQYRGTFAPYMGTALQGYLGTALQEYLGTALQGCLGTALQGAPKHSTLKQAGAVQVGDELLHRAPVRPFSS